MNDISTAQDNLHKPSHPILFAIFYFPFGIFSGYLTVTLAYLFSRSGISVAQIAGLAAINFLPQIFKFVWAPLVDTTFTVKSWYFVSVLATALCLFATGIIPINAGNLILFNGMILISSFARSFTSAAIGSLAAHDSSADVKGRVAGYSQAGNMGGGAVGGGIGLWLAQHTAYVWVPGAALALISVLCCIGLFFVREPISTLRLRSVALTIKNVANNVWDTLKRKRGLLALVLCLMPIGTGAASYLFAAIAKDWKASADTVALVTGVIGGLVTMAGSLIGGWICDLMPRQKAYIILVVVQALSNVGMAVSPHTQLMYIVWTITYAFTFGLVCAGYSAFILEAIGRGAAASKFELYSSIGYAPVYVMTLVCGLAYTKWGGNGVLITEAVS